MKVCLLLHGLRDSRATGLLRLQSYLENAGYATVPIKYGWFFVRGFAWAPFNVPIARVIACFVSLLDRLGHSVTCIAHSNGATIAMKASALGAPFKILVLINGAVERDAKLGDKTGYLINCRVPTDPVLALSWVISPLTPWADLDGSLGNAGVKINADNRMWDINLTKEFGIFGSHGGFFAEDKVKQTGPWLVKVLQWANGELITPENLPPST